MLTKENHPQIKIDLDEIKAELCKKEFFYFVQEFWDIIIPELPVFNWHIKYLCNELQTIAQRVVARKPKFYDLIINIPPGSTKSTIATIMFPIWCWATDPTLRFITGSYAAGLSTEHSTKSRDLIRSEKFHLYFPNISLKIDRDNKTDYENNYTGSRTATSVGGTIMGKHAHIIIIDDPVNPEDALSQVTRDSANNWMDNTLSSRKVDKEITPTILIMQRLHQDDCTGHMLKKTGKKIKHICLPSELTDDVRPAKLKVLYKDGLLDPVRFSKEVLAEAKIDHGSIGYAGQYLQTPKSREGNMFKREWFEIVPMAPAGIKTVRFWDMAATEVKPGKDPDYTAGNKMGVKDGIYYIMDQKRRRERPAVVEQLVKQTAIVDGKSNFTYMEEEGGSSGKTVIAYYVKILVGYIFKGVRSTGSKVDRALAFSCQAEAGNVKLVKGPWNNDFLDELEIFPNGTYDDQVDSGSGAFNELHSAHKLQIGRA